MFLLCLFGSLQVQGQEETKSLGFLKADSLTQQGKIAEARTLYQQVRESYQRQRQWAPFVNATIALAATYTKSEEYQTGIAQLEDALQKTAFDAEGQAHLRASLYKQMALLYKHAYKYPLAVKATENELRMLNLAYEPDSNRDFVVAYYHMAEQLRYAEAPETALEYYSKAIAIATRLNLTDPGLTYVLYRSKGYNYFQLYNFEEALKSFEKGLELSLAHPQKQDLYVFDFYTSIAQVYQELGEFQQALSYLEKGSSIADHLTPHYGYWGFYYLLGTDYVLLEQPDKGLSYFKKALEIANLDSTKLAGNIAAYIGQCNAYRVLKQYDKAFASIAKADSLVHIQKGRYPNGIYHDMRGIRWHTAKVWEGVGDLEKAKYYYQDMLENYSNEKSKFHDIETLKDLAAIYEKQNNIDSALLYNQIAFIASCKTFDSYAPAELPKVEDLREKHDVYEVLKQKIHFTARYLAPTQGPEHAFASIDLADQYHDANIKKMNFLRAGKNSAILDQSIEIYLQGLQVAFDFHQKNPAPDLLASAFYYTQKMKAQQLWLTLLNSEASGFGNLPKTLLEQERDLLSNIQYYERMVLEAKQKGDTIAALGYENDYLFDRQVAYRELIRQMETKYPDYYESKYNFIPETEATLQQLLDEDELLIEYVLTDTAVFIFTLTQNEPLQLTKITLANQTAEQIQDFHKHLQKSSWMRRSNREKFVQMSHALYRQFLQPIESQIAQHQRLIIIGDGMTNYIPFETLLSSGEVKPYNELNYLIRQHEVSYHYSATLFAKARKKETTSTQGIYAFAPVYETTLFAPEIVAAVEDPAYSQLRAYRPDGTFAPLPESEKEVESIVELFHQKSIGQNTLALRSEATEANLKSELEKDYRFIHIAGHSFADVEHPKFSGIACFEEAEKDSTIKKEDGVLYTGEIYNISSQADLVTLSSCESGYGKLDRSEGLLGLNRAFIYAGTPNVVFSLWKVYDKVNADLMVDFYREVLDGKSYATGLRQAKLKLLDQEVTAAPHFWSPYLLIGR